MDCSLPGSSVHGILQARIQEWVAISFSRGSSWPRSRILVSCIAGRFFMDWPARESLTLWCIIKGSFLLWLCPSIRIYLSPSLQFSLVQLLSCVWLLRPHGLQHGRLPRPSPQPLRPAQPHVHGVCDIIQPSYPLSSPSSPAFNLVHHQGLFQWVSSLHPVSKVLELQLQRQSFQRIFRTDFL